MIFFFFFSSRRRHTRCGRDWSSDVCSSDLFPVSLLIRTENRPGMLADITGVISGAGSNIQMLESRPDKLHARIDVSLEINDRKQLELILANIKKISGVFGVERLHRDSGRGFNDRAVS